jgi:hypothetical protein
MYYILILFHKASPQGKTHMHNNQHRKQELSQQLNNYLDDCCFDVQGISTSSLSSIAETQLARILTKIAIGSATVWWSLIELKDFVNIRKSLKG